MPAIDTERNRENRLRRAVERIGKANGDYYALRKSRARNPHVDDEGGYQILNLNRNIPLDGVRFELDLDRVEGWVKANQ